MIKAIKLYFLKRRLEKLKREMKENDALFAHDDIHFTVYDCLQACVSENIIEVKAKIQDLEQAK